MAILQDLYRYRILTTDQLRRRYFSNSKSYVYQKVHAMKKSGLIISIHREFGGTAYYRLTDAGISFLKKQGIPVTKGTKDLYVSPRLLPYLVMSNDIMVELSPYGWEMQDSRETKARYRGLNRSGNIQGTLISPDGTEYGFFVLMESTRDQNMLKMIKEIETSGITNFLIFAKGRDSIWHFIERSREKKLVTNGALCVMDYAFGVEYLKSRLSDKRHFKRIFQDEQAPVHWLAPSDRTRFECIARYRDEEVYLVNLLDTDLMKVEAVHHYLGDIPRLQRFGEKLRRVLVLTEPGLRDLHGELLGESQYICYLELSRNRINAFRRPKGEMNNEPHHTGTEIDHEAHHGQESHRTRDCRSAERSAKKHVQSDETHIKGRTDLRPYRRTK
ncbi:replication-relaxation family protein [Planifilum fimeticola]|uniref:replication-relaxation family protein n=1 Tax=Planifilum fimeticola TaxID=201975 RepID=UPI001473379D|nr:replication-relaxation family protein [Planifilum fimeticola]